MEPTAQDLQRQIAEFVRAFGLLQPGRTPCGQPISTSEAHALGILAEQSGIRSTELARHLVLEKSTVSRLIASMVERGWVLLEPDSLDGRVKKIDLTAAGARAADRLAAARAGHFEAVLSSMNPDLRQSVVGALVELNRASRIVRQGVARAVGA